MKVIVTISPPDLVTNSLLFCFKAMLNSIEFYKEIFLDVVPVRIIVSWSNVNIKSAEKSKQLYFIFFIILGALIYLDFIILILICV